MITHHSQRKESQASEVEPARASLATRGFGESSSRSAGTAEHSLSRLSVLTPQAKLTVNQPGDKYEQEADAVADSVMQAPENDQPNALDTLASPPALQQCACQDEEKAQRKEGEGTTTPDVGAAVADGLSGGGHGLDDGTHDFMASRFGYDFSHVRVHTDEKASRSAESLGALAYTVGSDIVFRRGQYAPGTASGKRLLAHELTHVVQQTGGVSTKLADGAAHQGEPVRERSGETPHRQEAVFRKEGDQARSLSLTQISAPVVQRDLFDSPIWGSGPCISEKWNVAAAWGAVIAAGVVTVVGIIAAAPTLGIGLLMAAAGTVAVIAALIWAVSAHKGYQKCLASSSDADPAEKAKIDERLKQLEDWQKQIDDKKAQANASPDGGAPSPNGGAPAPAPAPDGGAPVPAAAP